VENSLNLVYWKW